MRIAKFTFIILIVCMFFVGCAKERENSLMTVKKDGTIESYIVEDFSLDYYNSEELKQSVVEDIAYFNEKYESEAMELSKFEYTEGVLKATMWYQDSNIYEEYNEEILFFGEMRETLQNEYMLNGMFYDVKDMQNKMTFTDVLNEENHIIVYSEPIDVKVPGKVLFISEGLNKGRGSKEVVVVDNTKDIYCVIYK